MIDPPASSPRRHRFAALLVLAPALTAGSGGAGCSSGDGGSSTDFDLPTAASLGGPVLATPRVQPIYFKGFPYQVQMDQFVARLAGSSYWPTVVAEYSVGALTAGPGYATNVVVPATVTDSDLPGLLTAALVEGTATIGAVRQDTVYALFFDPATSFTVMGQSFCGPGEPTAYHDEWTIQGTQVPVAVLPTCASFPGNKTLTGVDILTLALSHELVEAATDPLVNSHPAYGGIDNDHLLWAVAMSGAELGDLCENEEPMSIVPADIGYPVQRIWSNLSAKAGAGPCVPVPAGEVYFNAVATQHDHAVFTSPSGKMYTVPVMKAGIGTAATAQVNFRGGPDAPTNLRAVAFELDDANSIGLESPVVTAGLRGHTVTLPIATSSSPSGVFPLLIGATDPTNSAVHLWVGGVSRN